MFSGKTLLVRLLKLTNIAEGISAMLIEFKKSEQISKIGDDSLSSLSPIG